MSGTTIKMCFHWLSSFSIFTILWHWFSFFIELNFPNTLFSCKYLRIWTFSSIHFDDKIFHQVQVCLIPCHFPCSVVPFGVVQNTQRLPSFSIFLFFFFHFISQLLCCYVLFVFIDLFTIFDRNFWILNSQCNCYCLYLWFCHCYCHCNCILK